MNKWIKPWIIIPSLFLAVGLMLGLTLLETHALDEGQATPASSAHTLTPALKTSTSTQADAPGAIPVTGQQAAQPTPGTVAAEPATPVPTLLPTALPTATITPTRLPTLSPETWKQWPVMPTVSAQLRQLYQRALAEGRINPHAFSVLGDCQSEAESFLGVFDTSPGLVALMSQERRETVAQFQGSFFRYNPAAKSGSSASSLLFAPWNDNKEGKCLPGETPVDCELRVHRPSIVFVHLGTHYEAKARNYSYLGTIIEKVLATGAVPVLVTKADNLEGDEYVNQNIALLAAKYGLPVWNFWASVQNLPDQGLLPDKMLLTKDASTIHQIDALLALGWVWRAVQ